MVQKTKIRWTLWRIFLGLLKEIDYDSKKELSIIEQIKEKVQKKRREYKELFTKFN